MIAKLLLLMATALVLWVHSGTPSLPFTCVAFVFIGLNTLLLLASAFPHKNNDAAQIVGVLRNAWRKRQGVHL